MNQHRIIISVGPHNWYRVGISFEVWFWCLSSPTAPVIQFNSFIFFKISKIQNYSFVNRRWRFKYKNAIIHRFIFQCCLLSFERHAELVRKNRCAEMPSFRPYLSWPESECILWIICCLVGFVYNIDDVFFNYYQLILICFPTHI